MPRVGQAGSHFDGLARLAASRLEDRQRITPCSQFLEGEAPAPVGESGSGEGFSDAVKRHRRLAFRADPPRNFVEDLRGCGGRGKNQKPKAQHGNSLVAPPAAAWYTCEQGAGLWGRLVTCGGLITRHLRR